MAKMFSLAAAGMLLILVLFTSCPNPAGPNTPDVVKYTVTFDAAGGTPVPEAQSVKDGEKAVEPSVSPSKEGWYFSSWLTPEGKKYDFSTAVTQDITLKADWLVVVTFDANGGTIKGSKETSKKAYYAKSTQFSSPPSVERPDAAIEYNFLGWSLKKDATVESYAEDSFNLDAGSETSPVTLYAVWTESNVCTVTFDTNGSYTSISPISVIKGGKTAAPSDPYLSSHYFRYWSLDDKTEFDFNTSITESITLKALWTPKIYTLKSLANGTLVVDVYSNSPRVSEGCYTASYITSSDSNAKALPLTYVSQSTYYITFSFTPFSDSSADTYTVTVSDGVYSGSKNLAMVPVENLIVTSGDSKITVQWTKPANTSSYQVDVKDGSTLVYSNTTSSAEASIYGLTNGREYSVSVTIAGTSKTVSAAATPSITVKDTDWLYILYLDGDNNLNDPIYLDLNEVEYGLYKVRDGTSPKAGFASVNAVALWDGFGGDSQTTPQIGEEGTYIYEIGTDTSIDAMYTNDEGCVLSSNTKNLSYTAPWLVPRDDISQIYSFSDGEVNMGSKDTLVNFLDWVNDHYTADNVVLVFSNHGGGPRRMQTVTLEDGRSIRLNTDSGRKALCWDDTSGVSAFLKTKDVSDALSSAGYGTANKLDMILMDVCLGASIEDAYQFKDYADYYTASPNTVPGMGMDYVSMMESCTTSATVEYVGTQIVNDYKDFYTFSTSDWGEIISACGFSGGTTSENLSKVLWLSEMGISTLSLMDLSKMNDVASSIDALAELLVANKTKVFEGLYYDTVEEQLVAAANANTVPAPYLEYLKLYIRYGGTSGNSLYYMGSFSWLYDIGYIANNMQYISAATIGADANANAWPELNTAAGNLLTALDSAIVASWRDAPVAGNDIYPVLNTSINPFGLMISGETINISGGYIIPGSIPSFYETDLAFGAVSSWSDLLIEMFGN